MEHLLSSPKVKMRLIGCALFRRQEGRFCRKGYWHEEDAPSSKFLSDLASKPKADGYFWGKLGAEGQLKVHLRQVHFQVEGEAREELCAIVLASADYWTVAAQGLLQSIVSAAFHDFLDPRFRSKDNQEWSKKGKSWVASALLEREIIPYQTSMTGRLLDEHYDTQIAELQDDARHMVGDKPQSILAKIKKTGAAVVGPKGAVPHKPGNMTDRSYGDNLGDRTEGSIAEAEREGSLAAAIQSIWRPTFNDYLWGLQGSIKKADALPDLAWLSAKPQTAQSPADKEERLANLWNNVQMGILSDLPEPEAPVEAFMQRYKASKQARKPRSIKLESSSRDMFGDDSNEDSD